LSDLMTRMAGTLTGAGGDAAVFDGGSANAHFTIMRVD